MKNVANIRLFPEDLASGRGRLAYLGTSSTAAELVDGGALQGGAVVWSLWDGYLAEPSGQRMLRLLDEAEVPVIQHHTSGHAYVEDLKRLAAAFDPARLVPIHSEATDQFGSHFPRVDTICRRHMVAGLTMDTAEMRRWGRMGGTRSSVRHENQRLDRADRAGRSR